MDALGHTLAEIADRRVLVLAVALVVRSKLAALVEIDPYNLTVIETAEAWARGACPAAELAKVKAQGRKTRGGVDPCALLSLVDLDDEPAKTALAQLTQRVATSTWSASPEGRAWLRADPKNFNTPFARSPEASRGIVGVRARLADLVSGIASSANVEEAVQRHAAIVERLGQSPSPSGPPSPKTGPAVILVKHDELAEQPARKSEGDVVLIEAVTRHVKKHVGEIAMVYHDKDGRWVHLDVHVARASDALVLCTSGMSERPLRQYGRDGTKIWTELVTVLPADWPFDERALTSPERFWPFAWLRYIGRQPHRTNVAVNANETFGPMSPPDGPRATPFDGVLFLPSARLPKLEMVGRSIEHLAVIPIHASELEHARGNGSRSLVEKLRAQRADVERIDPDRPAVV
jgi:hypothetical protein